VSDAPPVLYHYTSQLGLLGILTDQAVWATKISHLNDGRELAYGFDLLRRYVEALDGFSSDDLDGRLLRHLREYLDRVGYMNLFVASFTEEGDLLSQWRGYGRPGDAYSIGFPEPLLASEAVRRSGYNLVRCRYALDEQQAALPQLLVTARDKLAFLLGQQDAPAVDVALESVGFEFIFQALAVAASLKDPAFKEEKEWRLIATRYVGPNRTSFRQGRHCLIPYEVVALDGMVTTPVTITIGPTQHPDLALDSVMQVFKARNMQYGLLSRSEVSYRDW
jgi:hypothetical protein